MTWLTRSVLAIGVGVSSASAHTGAAENYAIAGRRGPHSEPTPRSRSDTVPRLILGRDRDRDADRVSDGDRVAKAQRPLEVNRSGPGQPRAERRGPERGAPHMPWATMPWKRSLRPYSSSTWAGLMSPDITASSSTSRRLNVRSSEAVAPTSISSNVRFSSGGSAAGASTLVVAGAIRLRSRPHGAT